MRIVLASRETPASLAVLADATCPRPSSIDA
jgi:hypothetical protein